MSERVTELTNAANCLIDQCTAASQPALALDPPRARQFLFLYQQFDKR